MNKRACFTLACLSSAALPTFGMGVSDDPLLFKVMINQLEVRDAEEGHPIAWDATAWIGKDLDKLWLKSEGERLDGRTEEVETQLLYGRAISPYWDLQIGWRHDSQPQPSREWLAIGAQGLAPYRFEVDAALFVGESGRTAARLDLEYELMFTQRLVLTPEVEMNFYGKDDPDTGSGSGLSDIEAGLRLRYEIKREFAPYVGINWWKKYGDTAGYAREEGEETNDTQFVVGIRAWF